jgi:flavodoxin
MKSLIVCVSIAHGNTRRVADRMAQVLQAEVVEPEAVDPAALQDYDLVGFGSGIYFMAVHPRLWRLVRRLQRVDGVAAFTFFTSGAREVPLVGYGRPIRRRLAANGFRVLDSFSCRGFDTAGPLRLVGGINTGRPNDADLDRVEAFTMRLCDQGAHS